MADFFDGKKVVLTGASSGIGLALARHLAAGGASILATGARAEIDLPSGFPDIGYVSVDLTRADCADRLIQAVAARSWTGIDLMILNAGVGRQAPVEEESPGTIGRTVAVNLAAPILIARRFAPMLSESRGRLILIGSTAHRGAAAYPVYAASKAALTGLARSLRSEWQHRIAVQIIHPGPTRTPMHARAGHDPGRAGRLFMSPGSAAALIADAIVRGRPCPRIGIMARIAGFLRHGGMP